MRSVARMLAIVVILIGLVLLARPEVLFGLADRLITAPGLLGIGAVRIAVGLLLLAVAGQSRTPVFLRIAGILIILAGVVLPFMGVDRIRAIMNWEMVKSPALLRLSGLTIVAFGAFLTFTLTRGPRRA